MKVFIAALACCLSLQIAQATPQVSQDPAKIADAVRGALNLNSGDNATLGPIEGAKFMPACTNALAVSITGLAPYEQAAVHCGNPGWTLYVAVTVMIHASIVVAARQIAAGQVLQPGDVQLQSEPVTLYAGRRVFYDTAGLAGATASMSLAAGSILTADNVQQPLIVHAGQNVAVNINSGDVQLSIIAVASQSGRVGDTILFTNPSTGKRFPAVVTTNGPVVNLAY